LAVLSNRLLGLSNKAYMLDKNKKQQVINKFKTHDGDTGSSQVQIAILTEEIKELTNHLKTHKKDFSSRRGLLRKVNLRRKLLKYMEKEEPKLYQKLVTRLKIKKISIEDDNKLSDNKKQENDSKSESGVVDNNEKN